MIDMTHSSLSDGELALPFPQQLLELWPSPLVTFAPSGEIAQINAPASALFETHPDCLEALKQWRPVVLNGQEPTLSVPLPVQEGLRVFEWQSVVLRDGWLVVEGREATLERNLRQVLTESRERFKDLVEVSADFAWETGADGRFAFVSQHGALGFTPEQLIDRRPLDLGIGEPSDVVELFDPREPYTQREAWLTDALGRQVCLMGSGLPIIGRDGFPAGARGVARDVTVERQREAELAHARERERALTRIVVAIRDEIDPERAYAGAARATAMALTADGCRIVKSTDRRGLQVVAQFGPPLSQLDLGVITARLPADGSPAVLTGALGTRVLGARSSHHGQLNGSVYVWREEEAPDYTPDEISLMGAIANQIGIAHAHADYQEQLRWQSERDGMTGLYNRRTFMERLDKNLAEGGDRPSALLYIDLDNFKAVNDTHGHQMGDQVLLTLAGMLQDIASRGDLPARLGGDEFLVWLDNTDRDRAAMLSERLIREGIEKMRPFSSSPEKPVGLSIGIGLHAPGEEQSGEQLIVKADDGMYVAKKGGKNRYSFAGEETASVTG
ncbi:diguanylate cyclase domain-containing protein [Radicibacter daui]|uniref:diguanylate cyclase domain-containing protein n=1 Tax=Radicibacter daui TaxID=3064829 RepID=UPI004046EB67